METNNTNIFRDSMFDDTSVIKSKDELVIEILPRLQAILKERFPKDTKKQRIKQYKDRLAFAAPCCGDSLSDSSKKRGNLILEGKHQNMYKCFNCGVYMSMTDFFKKYNQTLSLGAIDYLATHKVDFSFLNSLNDTSSNLLFDAEFIDTYAIDREYLKEKCHLEECSLPNTGNYYLRGRNQYGFSNFLYHAKHNLLFVLNLTISGKIIGMQVKNLNKFYKGPKYKTYNLTNIYKLLLKQEVEVPPEIDTLSMLFNILRVNYNTPIVAVEGPMDSFLVKNCVALCGASKHIPINLQFKFLFDDDETGRKHSIEKLNEGFEVFMWDKLKKEYQMPKRKKWDVNDLVNWCIENKINIPNFMNYFSNDTLDLLDI